METPAFDVAAMLAPPDILQCKRVLCIQPHPDDNEIGMGAIIPLLVQRGCEVHYLTVTNGDQGNLDRAATPEETARTRRAETELAGRYLGATGFHYLERGDGTLSDVLSLSVEIASVIRTVQPDAIFCPDPFLPYECHLDHYVVGKAAANAFMMAGRTTIPEKKPTPPAAVSAIGYYYTAAPNVVFDVSETFGRQFEAIALHKSQMDEMTLGMYHVYFQMKAAELASGRGFALGAGLKVLSQLHSHCFVDAGRI